jgi:ribosomal protein S18 acetylase RimI-like enzyme
MKNRFRSLFPQAQRHLLMGRVASPPQAPATSPGVEVLSIHRVADPATQALDDFATANGFPAGWARDMLGDGAQALAARDATTGEILAMGWSTRRPFHVDEIGATLNPGGGVYLFGDFVAPRHRGRKLQKLLISHRLTQLEGLPFACTLVEPSNVASVRSYAGEGFSVGGTYVRYRWRKKTWARCKSVRNAPVMFESPACDTVIATHGSRPERDVMTQ